MTLGKFSYLALVFNLNLIVSGAAFGAVSDPQGSAVSGSGVQIQTFKTHSRILFSIDESVTAHLKSNAKGFELVFDGIGLSDVGAPLGEEKTWAEQFDQKGDPRVQNLKFSETGAGLKVEGAWKFPQGKQALITPQMETFEYRQGTPAHYVLDFWLKQGSLTRSQFDAKKKDQETAERQKRIEEDKREKAERKIASLKRMAEINDTTRFCKQPITDSNDVSLRFLPVHQSVDFKQWFPTVTPDSAPGPYHYEEGDSAKPDGQYVKLALDLYKQGKYALTLRTIDFFDKEQGESAYKREMAFLRANTLIKLGMPEKAQPILKSLMSQAKDSPEALSSAMYLAAKEMEKNNPLAATDALLWLETNQPGSAQSWIFHLGVAEQLFTLNQTDRALKEYEWVVEKSPNAAAKAMAGLRSADLYMARFEYDQALAGYFQALHYFENEAKNYPPIYINRAEALYGLGQYDRAKEAFNEFLTRFPGHPSGWRATYRLGEIEGRKLDPESQTASRAQFYNTINQFPFSPGATLARLRLLPCGDHGGMNYETAEKFFTEDLAQYTGQGEVDMVPFKGLASLAHFRTLIAFGKEPQAVDAAITELSKPSNLELHEMIRDSLNGVFRKSILRLLASGKKYEALDFYKEKSSMLPKTATFPEETDYLLKLSEAASDLGLGSLAKEITDHYAQMNSKTNAKGRDVASVGGGDLGEHLQSSEQHFTQGKAMWVSQGMKAEALVRKQLEQVQAESPFSYQKELILGLMDQQGGKLASALAHAVRAQLLNPTSEGVETKDLRVQSWIADLQFQAGDKGVAYEMYRNLENHLRLEKELAKKAVGKNTAPAIDSESLTLGIPPMPSLDNLVIAEGQILESQGRWGEAATTYTRAIGDKLGGNQVVYRYAMSLRKIGTTADRAKSREVLEKLAADRDPAATGDAASAAVGEETDFWKKLAKEALADEKSAP
jgi:tetratricopeptide (TPR) repeat protein